MDAPTLARRLADPSLPHAQRLAALSVDEALQQPVSTLLPPARAASVVLEAVKGWLATEGALLALGRAVESIRQEALAVDSLGDELPEQLVEGLERWLARPWSPDRAVVLALLDRKPVRQLIRQLLKDALLEFGESVTAPVQGVARGLTGFAKKATERAGVFGAVASVVGSEVERQLERRAADFADQALSGVLQKLADDFSSPSRAEAQAEMRAALFEGFLGIHGGALAREVTRADVVGGTRVLREAMDGWLSSAVGEAQLRRTVERIVAREAHRPAGEVLEELGLRAALRGFVVEMLTERIRAVAATEAFHAFAAELLAE
ncbi:MAG: hypothetical protein RL653_3317 [Pseudomonadota bacterium]|jgi:hypothetical protein